MQQKAPTDDLIVNRLEAGCAAVEERRMGVKPLEEQFSGVSDLGIRVERVGGLTVWEAQPVFKHQTEVFRIQTSIRRSEGGDCGCVHVADCSLLFADGSQKRPDISIFCHVPEEFDSSVTLLPEAVIELSARIKKQKITTSGCRSISEWASKM